MSVEEARGFFTEKAVRPMLGALADVGLGYISLGQPLNTLSGGERQRLKLAIEMASDTPGARARRADRPGCTWTTSTSWSTCWTAWSTAAGRVIVVEHDLVVVARADWVIDMGPGAGHDGGTIVFEGPPARSSTRRAR